MFKEFRDFAVKGNVMDLAIGVIIGAAFGKIVTSLVNDLVMPLLSIVTGRINFANLFLILGDTEGKTYLTIAEANAAKLATLNYGLFITSVVDFLIISFCIFIVVRQLNKLLPKKAAVDAPATKTCPFCQSSISLKATRCPHCTSQLEG